MAQFIHFFDERDLSKVRKSGIKISKAKGRALNGVFVFPQTENFVVSHQWMRELCRRAGQVLVAARIRIDDSENVYVGKYNEEHINVSAAVAIGIVRKHTDAMGLEVIIPRSIKPKEIQSFYNPPKIVGWRYYPQSHGRAPCGCPFCQRGEPYGRRLREAYNNDA